MVLRSSQQVQSLSQLCLVGDLQQQTHHQLDAANLEHLLKMEYGHREKFLFFSYYTVKFSDGIIHRSPADCKKVLSIPETS